MNLLNQLIIRVATIPDKRYIVGYFFGPQDAEDGSIEFSLDCSSTVQNDCPQGL